MDQIIELLVSQACGGMRIDAFLSANTEYSRSRVSALMLEGVMRVDGEAQAKH